MANKLMEIKDLLDLRKGEQVLLRTNAGRQKIVEKTGVLAETYPSVFIVQLNGTSGRAECVSYSYTDVLTETVKVIFDDEQAEILA